jgi:acyl dehydratase
LGQPVIDESIAGASLSAFTVDVDRSQIRLFAKAIAEPDPVFTDVDAAIAAGHPDLPVPPTLLLGLASQNDDLLNLLVGAGADFKTMLHGEQAFDYHGVAHAGDRLRFGPRIGNVYDKKGGALQFVVQQTDVTNDVNDERIATLEMTLIFRNGG